MTELAAAQAMIRTRSTRAGLPALARPSASRLKIAMPTSRASASTQLAADWCLAWNTYRYCAFSDTANSPVPRTNNSAVATAIRALPGSRPLPPAAAPVIPGPSWTWMGRRNGPGACPGSSREASAATVLITGANSVSSLPRPLTGVSSAKSWHRPAAAWGGCGQVIRGALRGSGRRAGGERGSQRECSLAVPPPGGELAAAGAAVDDLDSSGGHALRGGAAGGLAQLPGPVQQPGDPAVRGGQPLDGALLGQVAVVALAQQADAVNDGPVQPGLAVGVADDPQRAGQHCRSAPGIDAAQRGNCGDPAAAASDPQPQRADDPVDVGFRAAAGLDGDLELRERVHGESVVEFEEDLGLGRLGQALVAPALGLLVPPATKPLLEGGDPVLPVDQVVPAAAVADRRGAHLLDVEHRRQLVHPGLIQVSLGQRVDPHLSERHPPQPRGPLDPALSLAIAGHWDASLIWRANRDSARVERVMEAAHAAASAGSSSAGSASSTPITRPSRASTVCRTIRLESCRRVRPIIASAGMAMRCSRATPRTRLSPTPSWQAIWWEDTPRPGRSPI